MEMAAKTGVDGVWYRVAQGKTGEYTQNPPGNRLGTAWEVPPRPYRKPRAEINQPMPKPPAPATEWPSYTALISVPPPLDALGCSPGRAEVYPAVFLQGDQQKNKGQSQQNMDFSRLKTLKILRVSHNGTLCGPRWP